MNLNPQQEGTRIYVPIPKVTKETRTNLVKSAQHVMNDSIEKLRKTTNAKTKQLNDSFESGSLKVSQDSIKDAQDLLRLLESHFVQLAREMTEIKKKDLMSK